MSREAERQRKRDSGWIDLFVWLPPEGKAALETLQQRFPDRKRPALITDALVAMVEGLPAPAAAVETAALLARLEQVETDIASLKARVEGNTISHDIAKYDTLEKSRKKTAGRRTAIDSNLLMDRIAQKRLEGDAYSVASHCRELLAEGVAVHKNSTHLAAFAKKHEAEITRRMQALQAGRG